MKRESYGVMAAVLIAASSPALAASDYLLVLDGVDGAAPATIEIQSWSWGLSNAGSASSPKRVVAPREVGSGQASGRAAVRESPTRASTGRTERAATGDTDGDGAPDLMAVAAQDEVQGFSLTLDGSSPQVQRMCGSGKHIAKAELRGRGQNLVLEDAMVTSCTTTRQTQSQSFGERCASGQCAAGAVTMTFSGKIREKRGHVTLIK